MKKHYKYMCKRCWYDWQSFLKYTTCPKCKSGNIDVDYDLDFEEDKG